MGATAAVVLLAVVGTTPNAGAGPHPERCALLRARVERGFLHQMGACRERETRRGQPPTPRCSDAPSGFAGLCWP